MSGPLRVALLGPGCTAFADGLAPLVKATCVLDRIEADTSAAERDRMLAGADALIAIALDKSAPAMPKLKLVQVPGAGTDAVDVAAIPRGVPLCNVFEHEPGCSEYALLAMLEWVARLASADRAVRAGDWTRSARYGGAPHGEIANKTVAIVGVGRIGRAVARRAKAFDMRVIGVNRTVRSGERDFDAMFGLDRLEEAMGQADFVVLGCALTPETRGLIGARAFAAMKPTTFVVNVARGPVIDEAALWDALSSRRIGGAAIDTWWRYPPGGRCDPAKEPYRFDTLDNVILSPHIGGWTTGTVERRTRFMAENLGRLARGETLENQVAVGTR